MKVLAIVLSAVLALAAAFGPGDEAWDYVNVRDGAHMFYWLYGTTEKDVKTAPTILWLQGGPGASSTGFGNFLEIGKVDVDGNARNTTWLSEANLLFIDNPVGTGYSYVDDDSRLCTNGTQIAADLLVALDAVFSAHSDLQGPFYIFCESFGGWMTATLAHAWLLGDKDLSPAAEAARQRLLKDVNLVGMALGDSWVSPIDYVDTWGPYLYGLGVLNDADVVTVGAVTKECDEAVEKGDWTKAWELWDEVENVIGGLSDDVDWYFALTHHPSGDTSVRQSAASRVLGRYYEDPLTALMNGPIRKKLGIIPDNVTWGGQAGDVFQMMNVSFMQPVVSKVDDILKLNSSFLTTIYNGGLDLICCTIGTERWMQKLTWSGMQAFRNATKQPIVPPTGPAAGTKHSQAFLQRAGKDHLQAYWIFQSGHMAPAQTPDMALEMMRRIVNEK